MTIDTHTIGLVGIQTASYRDASVASSASGASLRTALDTNRRPSEAAGYDAAASAIVSISDAARIAAQSSDAQQQANPAPEEADSPDIVSANYLEGLLIDMLSARNFIGVSAADFQAARASGANSDLLLRRIEDAARRAGLVVEREIVRVYTGADQTTFQAPGVIRTAHD